MNHLNHHERAEDEDLDEGSMGEIRRSGSVVKMSKGLQVRIHGNLSSKGS